MNAAGTTDAGWLHGLKIVAVAVVAQAVWGMARTLCPDRQRATIAVIAALVALASQTALSQVLIIAVAGLVGWRLLGADALPAAPAMRVPLGHRASLIA
jgi:chromate transporter